MESSGIVTTVRTSVCLYISGLMNVQDRQQWPAGAEEFVRRLYKKGVGVALVGPRPEVKLGTKKHLKLFDRHDVVGLKRLSTAKSQPLELRLLSRKLKAWTRIRSDICVVSGGLGVWPRAFPGWTSQGVVSVDALSRFINEFNWLPGHRFLFLGSSNRVLGWASHLLDRGATACMVVEQGPELKCWRSHRDRFLSKGGRVFVNHQVLRVQDKVGGSSAVFLKNAEGTLVLDADTLVMSSVNQENLNGAVYWKQGLFYLQRPDSAADPVRDEGQQASYLDWSEVYWRVARQLGVVDHAEATGSIERIRDERRLLWSYRKVENNQTYVGKNLTRDSIQALRQAGSAPAAFTTAKPLASLECAEKLACRRCVVACPHEAISKKNLVDFPVLNSDACTGCGACVAACPSGAAVMIKEMPGSQMARYFLPDNTSEMWKEGDAIQVINRRGEVLASGRVVTSNTHREGFHRVVEVESAAYNLWDARGFRKLKRPQVDAKIPGDPATDPERADRGWITLNGVKRLSALNVPATVALWKMGYRRFEDALFCSDGSCHLCEIKVNGKPELACQSVIKEGDSLEFTQSPERTANACVCAQTSSEDVLQLAQEGVAEDLARELTGYGRGVCKGTWCENREDAPGTSDGKQRPCWPGFRHSPWKELWLEDVLPVTRQGS